MNIFVLDYDFQVCAKYHNNRHVVKMITEGNQLLNNALIKHDENYIPIYKQSHKNHPASIWCSQNISNFTWLASLTYELCREYTFRYGKTHKGEIILFELLDSKSILKIPQGKLTPFVQCMPDQYKCSDAVQAYRNYYIGEKQHIAQWKNRQIPEWFVKNV